MFRALQPAGNNISNTEGHQGVVVDIPCILGFRPLHGKARTRIAMQFHTRPTQSASVLALAGLPSLVRAACSMYVEALRSLSNRAYKNVYASLCMALSLSQRVAAKLLESSPLPAGGPA